MWLGRNMSNHNLNCWRVWRGQVWKYQFSFLISSCACSLSRVQLFVTLWTVAHQAPLSVELYKREYWRGWLFPSWGDLPDPRIKLVSPVSPALAGGFFTILPPGKPSFLPNFSQIFWAQSIQALSQSIVLDHYHLTPVGNALPIIKK